VGSVDVDGLKARTDIVSVVGSYVALKKRGAEFVGLCPFHADKNPSFWVSPAKGFCHCFACGANKDVIEFIQDMEGLDFKAACEHLGAETWQPKAPIQHERTTPLPERITSKPPPDAPAPNMLIRALGEPSHTYPIPRPRRESHRL
jgi:DNA primase catalytic core